MLIYFVRHGQTGSNVPGGVARLGADPPLTAIGQQQAAKAAQLLLKINSQPDLIVSSPYKRTQQTAKIIAQAYKTDFLVADDLKEADFGNWHGKPVDEARAAWQELEKAGDLDWRPDGGESWEAIAVRMIKAIEKFQQAGLSNVILVSHSLPIRYAIAQMTASQVDQPAAHYQLLTQPYETGSISALEGQNGLWKTLFLNRS